MLLAFDAPAFVRRAQQVEIAWEGLQAVCRREREQLLEMPRMRLARFVMLRESWPRDVSPIYGADDLAYLDGLYQDWKPSLRSAAKPARTEAEVVQALADLTRSFGRFNRRWLGYLGELDLRPINQLRDGYNRFYVLEKECALRSARLAREGFVPLAAVRVEDLLERFPVLKIPSSTKDQARNGDMI